MSKNLQFYIFLFLGIILLSCSHQPQELKTAEQLIETAPDSALHILQRMSPEKYKSDGNRALYGLLMIRTLDKKRLPLKPDSLLDFSIDWYQKHPDPDRLASCYLYKGRSYKYCFKYEKAMDFYLKALDEAKETKNKSLLGRINLDMGEIYTIQRDYPEARKKFGIAYSYFREGKFQLLAFYSLLYIGRTYHDASAYETARKYYQEIIPHAKDSLQKGSLYQEIGLNFSDSKQYDSALFYYRKIIKYPYIETNRAIRYYLLAKLYFELNQIDSSYFYASNSFRFNPEIHTQRECYRIMTNCKFIKGNTDSVTVYMNKYVALGDSIRKIDAQAKGSYIESMHNTKQEIVKARRWIIVLYIFLLLVISASVYIYIIKRRRNKQEKLQAEQIRLQQKIDIRKEVVMKKREILLRKIEEKKAGQEVEWKKARPEERCNMIVKMYDELLHLNDVSFFQKEMDTVLNNLVNKLKNRYPALTEKEINWCCFYLLKIPTEDIMVLFDYKVDSLKRMKQRLVNKVGVAGVSELDNFLKAILYE